MSKLTLTGQCLLFLLISYAIGVQGASYAATFEMPRVDSLLIAERVFKNECAREADCLIEWNVGEDFLSLGFGHFIWYSESNPGIFQESFRSYLQYARDAAETLPVWLDKTPFPPCPWHSREQFLSSKENRQYQDIWDFLIKTKQRQADYLVENTMTSLQKIIDAAPQEQRSRVTQYLTQLSSTSQGLYAIIDYVNFKGAGIGDTERFQGEGWGLLQVLLGMRDGQTSQEALAEFVRSAKDVLKHRVSVAPVDRHEENWLPGWLHRIDSYVATDSEFIK